MFLGLGHIIWENRIKLLLLPHINAKFSILLFAVWLNHNFYINFEFLEFLFKVLRVIFKYFVWSLTNK